MSERENLQWDQEPYRFLHENLSDRGNLPFFASPFYNLKGIMYVKFLFSTWICCYYLYPFIFILKIQTCWKKIPSAPGSLTVYYLREHGQLCWKVSGIISTLTWFILSNDEKFIKILKWYFLLWHMVFHED